MAKLNATKIKEFLPERITFNRRDISQINHRLNIKNPDETMAKTYAEEYLKILDEQVLAIKKQKEIYKKLSELYKHCAQYKVDCYYTACRFVELKLSNFIECKDRMPFNQKEEKGNWYNVYTRKTGYFEKSCYSILKEKNETKDPVEYVFNNFKEEFKEFVSLNYKILKKHHKNTYQDYSYLAFNNIADDF